MSVHFTILGSGSGGNCAYLETPGARLLIDAGLSGRQIRRRLATIARSPETLHGILLTHEHSDHVNGVAVTARKLGIPVYFTEGTHRAWMRWISPRRQMTYKQWLEQIRKQAAERQAEAEATADEGEPDENDLAEDAEAPEPVAPVKAKDPVWLPAVEYFAPGEPFEIGDISISPFTTPHDAADPCGFVFCAEGVRIGFATDLGYIPPNVKAQLKDLDLLLLESNHDLEMLRDGPYPWSVKQRVLSRVGHLSNEAAAGFLEDDYDGQAAYIILAHLSESNNLPELARVAAERALNGRASLLANMLLLAKQHEPLSPISF